jgi:hypothetical protein
LRFIVLTILSLFTLWNWLALGVTLLNCQILSEGQLAVVEEHPFSKLCGYRKYASLILSPPQNFYLPTPLIVYPRDILSFSVSPSRLNLLSIRLACYFRQKSITIARNRIQKFRTKPNDSTIVNDTVIFCCFWSLGECSETTSDT